MGIIDTCIQLGYELRSTQIGQKALATLSEIKNEESTPALSLFFSSVDKFHHKYDFAAADYSLKTIESNLSNEKIGNLCQSIVENDRIYTYSICLLQLYKITSGITQMALSPEVKYSLPTDIKVSPRVIRLVHSLAVEYQRTLLTRDLCFVRATDHTTLAKLISACDKYAEEHHKETIYIAGHFDLVDALIKDGFSKDRVLLVYKIMSAITYMRLAVYCGFFENLLTLSRQKNIEIIESSQKYGYDIVEFRSETIDPLKLHDGSWLMKVIDEDTQLSTYYQIQKKSFHFESRPESKYEVIVNAVSLEWL